MEVVLISERTRYNRIWNPDYIQCMYSVCKATSHAIVLSVLKSHFNPTLGSETRDISPYLRDVSDARGWLMQIEG